MKSAKVLALAIFAGAIGVARADDLETMIDRPTAGRAGGQAHVHHDPQDRLNYADPGARGTSHAARNTAVFLRPHPLPDPAGPRNFYRGEHAGRSVSFAGLSTDDPAFREREGVHRRPTNVGANVAAGPAALNEGPLLAAWTGLAGTVQQGGLELVGEVAGDRDRLVIAPPMLTPIDGQPVPSSAVQSSLQVGARIGWGGANVNGVHFTLTDAYGNNPNRYEISTPQNNSLNPNGKPVTLGFRDISLGKTWEEENAAYQAFTGVILGGETADDPALAIVMCGRRSYDNALGDDDRMNPYNWGRDQLAVLTASVDDLSIEPAWRKAVGWRKSSETRNVNDAPNAIGAAWAITVNKHPTRPWYAIGLANYLQAIGDADNGGQKGFAEGAWFLAHLEDGEWIVSDVETVFIADPAAGANDFRHNHAMMVAWDGDVPVAMTILSTDDPRPSSVVYRRGKRDALSHFAALVQEGSLVSGGLGSAVSWYNTAGESTTLGEHWYTWSADDPGHIMDPNNENAGWGPVRAVHGLIGSSQPKANGHQGVGMGQDGDFVYFGADEDDSTIHFVRVSDLAANTPRVEILSDLPRMRGCFAMARLPRGGIVAGVIDDPSSGDVDRGRILLGRDNVWGTLYNPPNFARLRSNGQTETMASTGNNSAFVRVRTDGPMRPSRGLIAERALVNELANGVITTVAGFNLTAAELSEAEVLALGVAPIPGAVHYRITQTHGGNREPLRITWDEIADLGPAAIMCAGYNLKGDRRGTGTFYWYATDGVAARPTFAAQSRAGMVCGPYGVASGWAVNSIRTAGSSLNTMGGSGVRPEATMRVGSLNPTVEDIDWIVAFALVQLDATDPMPHRFPGSTLPAAEASATIPDLTGELYAVGLTVECGRAFEDSVAPASGLIPIMRLADAANPTRSVGITADLGSSDAIVVDDGGDVAATITEIGDGGVRWWDGTMIHAILAYDGLHQRLFVSYDNRPFELTWTNAGEAWVPGQIRAEPSGVMLHQVTVQTGSAISTGAAAQAWFNQAMVGMTGPTGCNPADLAEPFGSLTFADIGAFLATFANQDPVADLAAPIGAFTFADISAFMTAFSAGCP